MTSASVINPERIREWLEKNINPDMVRTELISEGYEPDLAEAHVKEYLKLKYAKRQTNGFFLLIIGAVIGFISCVLTIVNPVPSMHDLFLYGLTSLSILIVFAGLYMVFE